MPSLGHFASWVGGADQKIVVIGFSVFNAAFMNGMYFLIQSQLSEDLSLPRHPTQATLEAEATAKK